MPVLPSRPLPLAAALGLGLSLLLTGCAAADPDAASAAGPSAEKAAEGKPAEDKSAEDKAAQDAVAVAPTPAADSSAAASSSEGGQGVVVSVTDGDTLRIRVHGVEERVRLLNIDTPETKHPQIGVECLGPEASAALTGMLPPGTVVTLQYDREPRDHYGRLLAGVSTGGVLINAEMARLGYGEPVTYPPNAMFRPAVDAAWAEARAHGRGRFAAGLSCTPGAAQAAAPTTTAPAPAAPAAPAPTVQAPAAAGIGPVAGDAATKTCPASHPVKANDNSGIYHLPHHQAYSRTNARHCYTTAVAAEADGYRAARR